MSRSISFSRTFISLLAIFVFSSGYSQNGTSNSIVNTGLGAGPNHGIFGTKTIIGKNGTGFLLGLGGIKGQLTYTVGAQLCIGWFYTSASYGATTVMKDADDVYTGIYNGWNFIAGSRINLDKKKKVYLEIGLGISTGVYGMDIAPVGDIGIGFRLGSLKKKEKVMNL